MNANLFVGGRRLAVALSIVWALAAAVVIALYAAQGPKSSTYGVSESEVAQHEASVGQASSAQPTDTFDADLKAAISGTTPQIGAGKPDDDFAAGLQAIINGTAPQQSSTSAERQSTIQAYLGPSDEHREMLLVLTGVAVVGLALIWGATFLIGWVVRGFMGSDTPE